MNLNKIIKRITFLKIIKYSPFILISILLFSFIFIKAKETPFTADESRTYLKFIDGSFIKIFEFKEANNHFLNTLLSNLTNFIFGNSELSLRLPNVISFIFYLFFSFLIINKLHNYFFKLSAFVLLNINPYLLDFFILCRGYGLSLSFILGSIYFLFEYIDNKYIKFLYLSLIFGFFSVLSNFTLLIYYISLLITMFIIIIKNNNYSFKINLKISNLIKDINFKFFLFILIYFITIFIIIYLTNIKATIINYETAENIIVEIEGIKDENHLNKIEILRGRPGSEDKYEYLDKKLNNTWTTSKKQYFRSLKLDIPVYLIDKVKKIKISIGDKLFEFDINYLIDKNISNKNIIKIEFTSTDLYYSKSFIPNLNNIINWSGDIKCLLLSINRSYSSIIFILFTVLLIFIMKITTNIIISFNLLTQEQTKPLYHISLILFLTIIFPIFSLQQEKAFFWGGSSNFINDTIGSLINYSFYDKEYFKFQYYFFLILIIFLFSLSIFLNIYFFKKNKKINKVFLIYNFIIISLITLCSLISLLEHFIFKIPYLKRRTAIFFLPLLYLLLIFIFFILFISQNKPIKILFIVIFITFTSLNLIHFINSMNLNYLYEWRYDTGYKDVINDIKDIKNRQLKNKYKLLIYDEIKYSINYYVKVKKIDNLEIFSDRYLKDENNLNFDFYIAKYNDVIKLQNMKEFKEYKISNNILFINKDFN